MPEVVALESPAFEPPDLSRRFGGVARLYGASGAQNLARAHVVVAGLGGVGSWCAEALARSGIGALTLIDMDHVAESNINRQVQAVSDTVGQAKGQAMAARIRQIHPACRVTVVDDFVTPDNVQPLLKAAEPVSALVDCVDDVRAKIAMVLAARTASRHTPLPLMVCGGAGGKTQPLALRQGDLAQAANDALLARVRQILRREHGYPRGQTKGRAPRMRVSALWVDEPVCLPEAWQNGQAADKSSRLACAGYGSVVTVTAAMGFAAAAQVMQWLQTGAAGPALAPLTPTGIAAS